MEFFWNFVSCQSSQTTVANFDNKTQVTWAIWIICFEQIYVILVGKVALYDVMSLESVVVQIFFTKVPLTVSSCQSLFLKMNVKFDFRNLNYLQFVTKHIQFGWYNSYDLQTAIYSEVISCLRSFVGYVVISQVTYALKKPKKQALEQDLRELSLWSLSVGYS